MMNQATRLRAGRNRFNEWVQTIQSRFGLSVPEHLQKAEFLPLLRAIAAGNSLGREACSRLFSWPGDWSTGRLVSLLPLPKIPRQIFHLTGLLNNICILDAAPCILVPNKNPTARELFFIVKQRQRNYDSHSSYWQTYSCPRTQTLHAILERTEDLPYDMRKWDPDLLNAYFRADLHDVPDKYSRGERSKEFLLSDRNLVTSNKLVNIRCIKRQQTAEKKQPAQIKNEGKKNTLTSKKFSWLDISAPVVTQPVDPLPVVPQEKAIIWGQSKIASAAVAAADAIYKSGKAGANNKHGPPFFQIDFEAAERKMMSNKMMSNLIHEYSLYNHSNPVDFVESDEAESNTTKEVEKVKGISYEEGIIDEWSEFK